MYKGVADGYTAGKNMAKDAGKNGKSMSELKKELSGLKAKDLTNPSKMQDLQKDIMSAGMRQIGGSHLGQELAGIQGGSFPSLGGT